MAPADSVRRVISFAGWAKPTGPAFGRPDDRLRVPTPAEPDGHGAKSAPLPALQMLAYFKKNLVDPSNAGSNLPRRMTASHRLNERPAVSLT